MRATKPTNSHRPRARIKARDEEEFQRWEELAESKRQERGNGAMLKDDRSSSESRSYPDQRIFMRHR